MNDTMKRLGLTLAGLMLTVFTLLVCIMVLDAFPSADMPPLVQTHWAAQPNVGLMEGYGGLILLYMQHVWLLWGVPISGIIVTFLVVNRTQNTAELEMFLERMHAMEMALRDARERADIATTRWDGMMHSLDDLFANSADAWLIADPAKGINRWNRAALELARLQRGGVDTLEGRGLEDVVPNVMQTDLGNALRTCADRKAVWSGEVAVPTLRLWLMAQVFPLGDDVAMVLRDISFKYRDDAALQNAETLLRQMVEESPRPVAVVSPDWHYRYVSRNWAHTLGLPERQSLAGASHKAMMPAFPEQLESYAETLKLGKVVHKDNERVMRRGEEAELTWRLLPWRDAAGQFGGAIFTVDDTTELTRLRQQVDQATERENALAYSDALTGLPNRQLFHDRLNMALAQAYRQLGKVALFFLDLDGFKAVNDQFGHDSGDLLLKQVATRLKACVRNTDTVARLGGDEFTIILNIRDKADAEMVAQKLLLAVREPYNLNGKLADKVGTSIGIALYPQDGNQAVDLIRKADNAMYAAKQGGKNAYRFSTMDLVVQG